jgi:very-short-patch-repair endonuclease
MKPWFFESEIEQIFREEMQKRGMRLGVDFVVQYPLKFSFIIDIAFPDNKLAIELDGNYWHSLNKNRQRDHMKDNILTKEGWKIIRISEDEIKNHIEYCVDFILYELNKIKHFNNN